MDDPRYTRRTVYWGHWGITFMNPQPDRSKNYGEIVGDLYFGVGNCGPVDGTIGSPTRLKYQQICKDWVENGKLPEGIQYK